MAKILDTDLATRSYRFATGFNEALYLAANEPSLGMYRIQEHIAVTVPKVVEHKQALLDLCQQVEGACYDLDYDTEAVKAMASITQFSGMKESIRKAVELKRKLDEVELQKRAQLQAELPVGRAPPPTLQNYGSIQQSPVLSSLGSSRGVFGLGGTRSNEPEIKPKSFD